MNSFATAIRGPSSFENYIDPQTGKPGNPNVGVTVGKFRDNQLVSRVCTVSCMCPRIASLWVTPDSAIGVMNL